MPKGPGVFALDLSSRTGWAFGHIEDDRPRSGVWVLPGLSDLGRTYAAFENMLLDAIDVHRPDVVVVEAAIAGGRSGGTNQSVTEQQIGLLAHARSACYRHDIRLVTKAASSMRKEVIGTGRFPEGQAKKMIMRWLHERGFSFSDDNAADATVAWLWAKQEWPKL
jgi:Holliday junction resolvasome RuvABC endonuclease subunit